MLKTIVTSVILAFSAQAAQEYTWNENTNTLTRSAAASAIDPSFNPNFFKDEFKPMSRNTFNIHTGMITPSGCVTIEKSIFELLSKNAGESFMSNLPGMIRYKNSFYSSNSVFWFGIYENTRHSYQIQLVERVISFYLNAENPSVLTWAEFWRMVEPQTHYKRIEFRPDGGEATVLLKNVYASGKNQLRCCTIETGQMMLIDGSLFPQS